MSKDTAELKAEFSQRRVNGSQLGGGVLKSLGLELGELLLCRVVSFSADPTLVLEAAEELVVVPSDGGGEVTKAGELAPGLQTEVLEGSGEHLWGEEG